VVVVVAKHNDDMGGDSAESFPLSYWEFSTRGVGLAIGEKCQIVLFSSKYG
jgi:hypothetical protein